jgi:hypothetical protein
MTRLSSKLREYEIICAEAYQIIGVLAHDANRFFDDDVTKILDNLSMQEIVHENILPFNPKNNLPSDREVKSAKDALESIKSSCPAEYYQSLKTILDYFN